MAGVVSISMGKDPEYYTQASKGRGRRGIARGTQGDQPELGLFPGETVQVDPLGVHEPDPAYRPPAARAGPADRFPDFGHERRC
jgi:hypothetical protein